MGRRGEAGTAVGTVVAVTPRGPRTGLLAIVFALQVAVWLFQAVDEGGAMRWLLVGLAGAGLLFTGVAAIGAPLAVLRLTDDELHLARRWRQPLVVRRDDVTDVRGDVEGRLTWSQATLVITAASTVTLKDLDQPPSALVPRLRAWAGLDATSS